ncbi:hypothetical protein J4429_00250 [Candidatus Pacearchaeota archaeon]|nr:hypothetical protein [Candidatus Pacearchaeota archaeon]
MQQKLKQKQSNQNISWNKLSSISKVYLLDIYRDILANEQIKKCQLLNNRDVYFKDSNMTLQGTSVSGLSSPAILDRPIIFDKNNSIKQNLDKFTSILAECYLKNMKNDLKVFKKAFPDDIEQFRKIGTYWVGHISAKMLGLIFKLDIDMDKLDPNKYRINVPFYQLMNNSKYSKLKKLYLEKTNNHSIKFISKKSFILSDSTGARGIVNDVNSKERSRIRILVPSNVNNILSIISKLTVKKINLLKSKYKETENLNLKSLALICSDTDSPEGIYRELEWRPIEGYPLTPGCFILGSTGSLDLYCLQAKYIYRLSLAAQEEMKNSITSNIKGKYTPVVWFGALSLHALTEHKIVDTEKLSELRYDGDYDPKKEFLHWINREGKEYLKGDLK